MVALAAFAAVMTVSALASAASVDIFIRQQPTLTEWTIGATSEVGIGQIALSVGGFTGMTLCAPATCPQISALDSPFVGGASSAIPGGATVQLTSLAGQNLVPSFQPEIVLATLTGPGPAYLFEDGSIDFGFTALNVALDTVIEDFTFVVVHHEVVPEPVTTVLLGVGLAALALARRTA
jgi:hypothetical protein